MKSIVSILAAGFLIIIACLIYLIKSGVSIRTAPIIKPSIIRADFENVPQGVFVRLFPDLQQSSYVLWNANSNSNDFQKTISVMKELSEKQMHRKVNFIYDGDQASAEMIQNCSAPCWILLSQVPSHELAPNPWIATNIKNLNKNYISISWIDFQRHIELNEACIKEKRLDLECLKQVSIHEVQNKMKDIQKRYFFMRKYLDHDYFLFVELTPSKID